MADINKETAVGLIHECAVLYSKNLCGRMVMFITENDHHTAFFETLFLPRNYLHLTGVRTSLNSEFFYEIALNQRLSPSNVSFDPGGTTVIKLGILRQLMSIHVSARMVGDYDNSRPLLITDKIAGTVTVAMGFLYVDGLYIPNTALKMDVRDVTAKATRRKVVAIFVKPREDALYSQLSYIAKGMSVDDPMLASILRMKVNMSNLYAEFPIPMKRSIPQQLVIAESETTENCQTECERLLKKDNQD